MKIVCVGRNYREHTAELGNKVPKEPVLFIKPDSSVLQKRNPFFLPDFSDNVQYECELVLRIDRLGKHIAEKFAHKYYHEIGLGIDFTARDLQNELKEKGLPWEKAKAFDGSCLVGSFLEKSVFEKMDDIPFRLEKNGETVQKGNSGGMIFHFDHLVSYISKYFTLKIGDLIFTGTPAGVGPVADGDRLVGYLAEKQVFAVNIK